MFVSTNTRWFCSFFHEWIREKPVRKIWWQSQGIPALKFCRPNGNHREKTAILAWKQNCYDVRIHAKVVTFSRGRYNWRAFIFHIKRVFWCFVRIQSDRNQRVKHDILHDLTDQKRQRWRNHLTSLLLIVIFMLLFLKISYPREKCSDITVTTACNIIFRY